MRSVFAISCRTVHIYHLKSQVENSFIHSLHSMGNRRNVATTMEKAIKKKFKQKKPKKTKKTPKKQTNRNKQRQTSKQINQVR